MRHESYYFPTEFAKEIAKKVGLYKVENEKFSYGSSDSLRVSDQRELLGEFQQIAVLHGSEVAMTLYSLAKLNRRQIRALKIIGDYSGVQVTGEAMKSMMHIVSSNHSHKEFAKIMEAMVDIIKMKNEEFSDNDKMQKMISQLLK